MFPRLRQRAGGVSVARDPQRLSRNRSRVGEVRRMIAQISVVPVGAEATSMRAYVEKAIEAIRSSGVKSRVTEMGTNVEGSLDDVLRAFKAAHDACTAAGAQRVMATLRIDDRLDRPETLEAQPQPIQ
jgi:uncharacterized protein (TIGR00106 family)